MQLRAKCKLPLQGLGKRYGLGKIWKRKKPGRTLLFCKGGFEKAGTELWLHWVKIVDRNNSCDISGDKDLANRVTWGHAARCRRCVHTGEHMVCLRWRGGEGGGRGDGTRWRFGGRGRCTLAGHARRLLVFRSTLGSVSTFSALWRFFQHARMGLRSRWYARVFTPSSFCELNYFVYIFCPCCQEHFEGYSQSADMAWYFFRIQHPWLAVSVRMFGACAVFGKLGWTKKLWRVDKREEIGRLLTMCTGVQCVSVCMQHSSIQLPQHTQTFPPALSPTPLPTPPIYLFIQPPPLSHPLHLNWFVRCFQAGSGKWACCIMWLVFSSGYRQGIHDTMSYLLCMTVIFIFLFLNAEK